MSYSEEGIKHLDPCIIVQVIILTKLYIAQINYHFSSQKKQ